MARAGLQGEPMPDRPTARGRRWSHSASWACFPQLHLRGQSQPSDQEKAPQKDDPGHEGYVPYSRGRGRLRQCQSPSPQCPSQLPLPSPPMILSCWQAAQPLHERSPPMTKIPQIQEQDVARWCHHTYWEETTKEETSQVWDGQGVGWWSHIFPGPDSLPTEGIAKEWDDAPSPSTPMTKDSPWLPPQQGPQFHPTYTGGVRPKVPTKPSASHSQSQPWSRPKEEPDPVNHPCRWIHVEMEKTRHPDWLKEIKASGRMSMVSYIIREGLSKSKACTGPNGRWQHSGCPLAQHEDLGWWDVPSLLTWAVSMGFQVPY